MSEPHEVAAETTNEQSEPGVSQASIKYIGQWRGLVSTTNWEKGKIIAEWRQNLIDNDASPAEFSDETWSQLVGDVTPQHVGRLRRVHQRFEETWPTYQGLYWTHFLAALDWEDAELWLEGALQNHWSVSQMRKQRWETLGSIPADEPLESQIIAEDGAEVDAFVDDERPSDLYIEDVENVASPASSASTSSSQPPGSSSKESNRKSDTPKSNSEEIGALATGLAAEPLESLDDFPEDFVDAFEDFRHVILEHKKTDWENISREEVLRSLESLRLVVLSD